ncbi:SAF domain-containing protein [Intrasporangium calvum]|uniref:SAF domain-containing protein n=1 Tax=Intrasporangium calvum TaxID=53358 RepID=A0ABT5GJL9_9MICO|nr:SAF domain-containing protein [Intrasporangium calvum]MDC5698065.1 SAF domain-containing protein [Intrasporangium calvum]
MSTLNSTHTAPTTPAMGQAGRSGAVPGGAPIAPPPKLRRRPMLVVASIAAICLGALLAVWAYTSTSTAREVVAARATVQRGELIDRDNLIVVRVSLDPALNPVPASALDSLVGQRAAMDLPAGGLVTADAVTAAVLPGKGSSVVGVSLPPALLPGELLRAGDHVRVVATPGQQGDVAEGEQRSIAAIVVGVHPDAQTGQTVVSVQVPYAAAAELAARAATGKVALVLDSRER